MKNTITLTLLCFLWLPPSVQAWTVPGHSRVTKAAMKILPKEMPAFFRDQATAVSHMAVDPDAMKQREFVELKNAESPEHYLDLEFLEGSELPEDRYKYMELLQRLDLTPYKVGFSPYAIAEGVQRLTVAFAEYRQWPDDPTIQAKIAIYAGLLSHYAGDLAQPLHTTVHHNGMTSKEEQYESPHTGIHLKIDRLFELLPEDDCELLIGIKATRFENVRQAFASQLVESHSQVSRVYDLEPSLEEFDKAMSNPKVSEFTIERYRVGAEFIASLFLTAWEDSADVELPWWLEYPGLKAVGQS